MNTEQIQHFLSKGYWGSLQTCSIHDLFYTWFCTSSSLLNYKYYLLLYFWWYNKSVDVIRAKKKVLYTGRAGSSFPQGNKPHWYKRVHTGIAEFTLGEGCINITEQQLKSSASCLHRQDLILRGFAPDLENTAKTPNSTSNLDTEKD